MNGLGFGDLGPAPVQRGWRQKPDRSSWDWNEGKDMMWSLAESGGIQVRLSPVGIAGSWGGFQGSIERAWVWEGQ